MHSDWIPLPVLLATMAALLFVLRRTRFGSLLREHIAERLRRRLFIASVSFFLTLPLCGDGVLHRAPYSAVLLRHHGRATHPSPGVRDFYPSSGRLWLCEVGNGSDSSSIFASSLMSLLYGLGAALTPSCPLLGYWRSVSVPS